MLIKPDYRLLWTWDFATYWDNSFFNRDRGCSGKNSRREAFLNDYKRLIDFASQHHINGVVIWGAVRAHNDGMEQLKELVKYGRSKGVRVLPGVSAFSYGGVCYDPRKNFNGTTDIPLDYHPYSLNSWLNKHPEYAAIDANGKPYEFGPFNVVACPSRKETVEWFKEALEWLYDEFDVDGIQVEVGDYAACHCPLCDARRSVHSDEDYSISDMLSTYTAALEVSHAAKSDPWVICETYSSIASKCKEEPAHWYGWHSMEQSDRELLSKLPKEAILQWGVDKAVGGYAYQSWPENIYTPSKNNILRIHAGSQWSTNKPADWGVSLVWEMVKNARSHGLNGISIFGEESVFSPPNEANYLAFEEASGFGNENPDCDEKLFYKNTLDPLYGGNGLSTRWRELYIKGSMLLLGNRLNDTESIISRQPLEILTDEPDFRIKALNLSKYDKAKEIEKYLEEVKSISSALSGEECRRWNWLENKLWNMRYIIGTN